MSTQKPEKKRVTTITDEWGLFTPIPNQFIEASYCFSDQARWLFVLLRFTTNGESKKAFPSYNDIHKLTGWATKTISKAIKELATHGWLVKEKQFGGNTHYILKRPNPSVLSLGQDWPKDSIDAPVSSLDCQSFPLASTGQETGQSFPLGSTVLSSGKDINRTILKTDLPKTELPRGGDSPSYPSEVFAPVFDCFDSAKYEADVEQIQAELITLFPALNSPSNASRLGELTMLVCNLGAPATYVAAWRGWFQARYAGQIANPFKFNDTFPELAKTGIEANAWLNGSVGARFVAHVCGLLDNRPVTASTANRVVAIGHWLDDNIKLGDKENWIKKGVQPKNFHKFWKEKFPSAANPNPDSVMKYALEFYQWLEQRGVPSE